MSIVTRWWWVRHAPVPSGKDIVYGQFDLDADCSDAASFRGLAGLLPRDAVLLTSDLRRTIQTADAIRDAGLALAGNVEDAALREQSFGAWQGKSNAEFAALPETTPHRHWRAPAYFRAPDGESFAEIVARVVPAIDRYTAQHSGRDIIAVTHGGTIRAALANALGLDPETALAFGTENLSVTRLDHIADDRLGNAWRVVMVNHAPAGR